MTYSNYATKLNNESNLIESLLTSLNTIDFDSSWTGNAATKQISNLEKILTDKNIQLHNIEDLTSVLLLIDEYDNEKKLVKEYDININNLNKEDPNYQSNVNNLISLKNKSVNNYESLKKQINEKLSNITTRYSEQYVNLPPTNVENTVNLFKLSEEKLNSIDSSLQFQVTKFTKDKTTTQNSGTLVSIDKEGTKYDYEPTPGKSAQRLSVYHNGTRLYDAAYITVKKGETIRLNVNLSDNAGEVKLLKRTTADGQENWRNYMSAHSEPYVNRYDSSTYLSTDNYEWVITADQVTQGYVTLSQTTFHSTENAPEYKSMYRIHIKVVN